jgi:hypothetical protein
MRPKELLPKIRAFTPKFPVTAADMADGGITMKLGWHSTRQGLDVDEVYS